MAKVKRLFKSFSRLLLPVFFLIVSAIMGSAVWLVHKTAEPTKAAYLVTPDKYGQLSARAAQLTSETWGNKDGSNARGWLLRGSESAPAVILLHRYGADRSHVLNLGVKLSEATNFTVLMPDQRGHGENAMVRNATFGGCEADDVESAIEYLRSLKTQAQSPLVGKHIGIYGVELGALAAVNAAGHNPTIKTLVLDSVPFDSDHLLASSIGKRFPFMSNVTSEFAKLGTYFYYFDGCYKRDSACAAAKAADNRQVLLLGGSDAPQFQESTQKISNCFPNTTKTETKTDLSPSGYNVINASLEQTEVYDQRVIEFFRANLTN